MPEPVSPVVPLTPLVDPAGSPPGTPESSTFTASNRDSEPSESHTPEGSPTSPLAPLLPLTPASAPSPTSPQTPPGAPNVQYFISPHKLWTTNCSCVRPHRELTTANQHIQYMVGRLEKVMQRMTRVNKVDTGVKDAFVRILYELRGRGWELFHLVGWQRLVQGKPPRRAYHIAFMLPDIEEPSCHRALAELLIHCVEIGQYQGMVERVAVRFAEDWDDWTVSLITELAKDANAGPPKPIALDMAKRQGRSAVLEAIWSEVVALTNGEHEDSKHDFLFRFGRTLDRLEEDGEVLTGVQIEKVGRLLKSGSGRARTAPTIRIPILTRRKVEGGEEQGASLEGEKVSEEKPSAGETNIPAVILIELPRNNLKRKFKHISTVYHGEWPITHHYSTSNPAPTMRGLEKMVIKSA